ncbi:MAG: glycosyltransferase family 2 protein [Chitinivibrionales bacterium]|nr:glycosyltransferase family 2 protein [Chitinivibrionales bacterium]MBD3357019.1 glycosyltransferase family 2 protein [Chitinivibrionales bacterium]
MDLNSIPVFIITRDRVSCLLRLIAWLEKIKMRNIWIIDNASSYPPMLAYLRATPHHVIPLDINVGHFVPWAIPQLCSIMEKTWYIVSDPDVVPDTHCPEDAVERFVKLLIRHPGYAKAGFSLSIDDIPDHFLHKQQVIAWEKKFWKHEVEPGVFNADIDTTFAVYRPGVTQYCLGPALRTASPYFCRHLPWYLHNDCLSQEERYYRSRLKPGISNWNQEKSPRIDKTDELHCCQDMSRLA